jgi:hypothetical protein
MMAAEYTVDDWMSMIGEGLHTGFRKGSDHPENMKYWKIIQEMPTELWDDALRYLVSGLEYSGVIEVRKEDE